jgi:ligand-binding sensor domain-containing protein
MIATRAGVARFDGERWTSPPELAFPVNDLAVSRDGRLWLATARGIAVHDGRRVRRVDVRRGLLENEIGEIVVDDYGRLWARGARSLAVISP